VSGPIAILGATGYTGRLCAQVAADQGLDVVLAARRPEPLARLAEELGGLPTAQVDVADRRALRRLAESAGVLVTTVGPYSRLGRPALLAALDGDCHYVDVSGELPFLEWARGHDEEAREAGVALCPGFGFDGLPGDLLAGIATGALDGPARQARAAYLVRGGRASAGTLRSAIEMVGETGAAWRGGQRVAEPVAADRWRVPFPQPLGPRDAVSAPLPDVLTLGPSTGARDARAYAVVPGARLLPPVAGPLHAGLRALVRSPAGDALRRLADRLPEGPGPEQRAASRTFVLAEVEGESGAVRAWARLRDLYLATAHIALGTATRLLREGPPRPGALTPTELFAGDAGAFLQSIGADWAMD
jgi:short subunit dehydrogenase-like uncharacterized protein